MRILLIGAGHAHCLILRELKGIAACTLISETEYSYYSGMFPVLFLWYHIAIGIPCWRAQRGCNQNWSPGAM